MHLFLDQIDDRSIPRSKNVTPRQPYHHTSFLTHSENKCTSLGKKGMKRATLSHLHSLFDIIRSTLSRGYIKVLGLASKTSLDLTFSLRVPTFHDFEMFTKSAVLLALPAFTAAQYGAPPSNPGPTTSAAASVPSAPANSGNQINVCDFGLFCKGCYF